MVRYSHFFLGAILFLLLNISQERLDALRARVVGFCAPLWQSAAFAAKESPHRMEEVELCLLRAQLQELKECLLFQPKQTSCATPAKVLFRDPSQWSSSIWISLGEEDNRDQILIAKNSPVLLGNSLVGVVEYVGYTQSRVRLITDAGLTSAVRVVRGGTQNRECLTHLELLQDHLRVRSDLFESEQEQEYFLKFFQTLQGRLVSSKEEFLAKGELHGRSTPLWKSSSPILQGVGFNYDFSDAYGEARDLRSSSLIKLGDLLVTSGLDGVFPAGIPVALVTKIEPLKDGDYFYNLEAKPTAGNLQDLHTVFVLPPTVKEGL